jgi:hypothetical protein
MHQGVASRHSRLGGNGCHTERRQTESDESFAPEGSPALTELNQVFHKFFVLELLSLQAGTGANLTWKMRLF